MTWTTPLEARTSGTTTAAPFIVTPHGDVDSCTFSPLRVVIRARGRFAVVALVPITWYVRTLVKASTFPGRSRASRAPAGRAAKASSVGADRLQREEERRDARIREEEGSPSQHPWKRILRQWRHRVSSWIMLFGLLKLPTTCAEVSVMAATITALPGGGPLPPPQATT